MEELTIAQFIEILRALPPDAHVGYNDYSGYGARTITADDVSYDRDENTVFIRCDL